LNPKGIINYLRRKTTRFFSKILVNNKLSEDDFSQNITLVKKVLVSRPNHRLGNNLLLTPLIKEISEIFPNAEIHIFTKGSLVDVVFDNYKNVTRLIKLPRKPFKNLIEYFSCWFSILREKYDISINANRVSSSGKLAIKFSRSNYKFYNILNENSELIIDDYSHNAKNPVYNLRFLVKNKINRSKIIIPKLDIKLRDYEIKNGEKLLKSMFRDQKPVISIFTFATGEKCYNKTWWKNLYQKIKALEKNYNILEILPAENISQIDFDAKSYYSRDIREISSVMFNTKIFIGADSGMMHLAHASNVTTIGLFSVTEPEFYGVYGDNNISIDTNKKDGDYIISTILKRI
tara:strand:- start:90 stop:1130 length:1041 start_codon:yes stop_codon:yes gene_type:complete